MAIYAIGDPHLSFGADKPMDLFQGWLDYAVRLEENWKLLVKDQDTVLIAGDVSWAMTPEEAVPDFIFLDRLPGRKILLKGNHDYWWTTRAKLEKLFEQHSISTLDLLHNNAYSVEGVALAGTRGWFVEQGEGHGSKVFQRELIRLRASLEAAKQLQTKEIVAFLHYPPVYAHFALAEYLDILKEYGVARCFYGHVHGKSIRFAVNKTIDSVSFQLISADYLNFRPMRIHP